MRVGIGREHVDMRVRIGREHIDMNVRRGREAGLYGGEDEEGGRVTQE